MKYLVSTILIGLSTFLYSQEYNFKPLWNKGDKKQISISQNEREFEDGILISDTTTYNEASIEVIEDLKDSYTLKILFENQALTAAIELYDKLEEELKDYKDLKLIYSVNKETAEAELLNWEEAQDFMNGSFDQIGTILEEKTPDIAPLIGYVFMPIKEAFKSKENIEAYMEPQIAFLLLPYNKQFKIGETISQTDSQENPFNPMQEVAATTLLSLESVDNKNSNCLIKQEIKLDLSSFIEMMKGMMEEMAAAFGVDDSSAAKKNKEMDELEMDIINVNNITFNYSSSWVTQAVNTVTVKGTDPKKGVKSKKEVITTTTIN